MTRVIFVLRYKTPKQNAEEKRCLQNAETTQHFTL
jgi:hypothetical protein